MQKTGEKKFAAWKLLMIGAVALAAGGTVVAQTVARFEPGNHVAMMAERAQKEWNLSNDQKAKIKIIMQDAIPRGVAIHDNMKLAPATRQAKLKELYVSTQTKIHALLTPAQREKAANWQQGARSGLQQTLVRVGTELKLTPNQQARLRPIVIKGFDQAQALRGNMNLTVAQKFMRLQQIRKSTRAQVGEVLTAQQNAQLDKMTNAMFAEARRQFVMWRDTDNK